MKAKASKVLSACEGLPLHVREYDFAGAMLDQSRYIRRSPLSKGGNLFAHPLLCDRARDRCRPHAMQIGS
jgi:hypothetical protein